VTSTSQFQKKWPLSKHDHRQRVRLLAGRAARGQDPQRALARAGLALLDLRQHVVGEHLQLGQLAIEVGLVVGEVAHHALQLLGPVGAEAQLVEVVLERAQAAAGQAVLQAGTQGRALVLVEVQPELLVDEVAQQAERFLVELDVEVVGPVHAGSP
jgi:hypothetical protein